ncbi:MAG: adenylate/guanylate cyclase domain-containing protein [Planctomycetota bacterium]|jgi:TolB-like protein/class 3 adenylate cyclase/Flp pilus assembly protein TadD
MTQESFKRKLTAILSADVEGYSRLMSEDEEATVRTLTTYREVMTTLIQQHNGKVLDSPGDNLLAEFASVVDAVQCAVSVQKEINTRNAELSEDRRMQFRIGINLGDVIQEEDRIYGDGVNIAARLEGLADPGGICISKTAFDHIESKLPYGYEYLGDQTVKNIPKPVGAYRVLLEPRVTVAGEPEKEKPMLGRRMPIFVGAVAVIVLAVAVGIWYFFMRTTQPPIETASPEKMAFPLPDKPSIAVLPFDNLSDDPKQEYFSDGMTDDLITDLSKIAGLFVIARNSAFQYKGKAVDVKKVSRELGVRYVLEGSVRRAKDRVRINAQLIDATTGGHLWAERYDEQMDNIFSLQDKITQEIVKALSLKLTGREQEVVGSKETDSIEAYDAFMQGWVHYRRSTPDDFVKAISFFEKAIELDPKYWRAYAALASTYFYSFRRGKTWTLPLGVNRNEAFRRADKYLEVAMNNPTPLAHQVATEWHIKRAEYETAIAEAERAVVLDSNDPGSHLAMAWALMSVGRHREGADSVKRAMRLDPVQRPYYSLALGVAHFLMKDFQEAVTLCENALKRNPDNHSPLWVLAAAYAHLGREKEAKAAFAKFGEKQQGLSRPDIRWWTFKYKDPADFKLIDDGLRKAGAE